VRFPTRGSRNRRSRRRNAGDSVGKFSADAWSLAKRAVNGMNEIRKLINVEQKYIDVSITSNTTQAGTVTYLSPVAQGDNVSNREGDSIKIQSFEISGSVYRATLASATNLETVRVMVIRDLQNQGADPIGSDVLELVSNDHVPFSELNFLNASDLNKRFTIVYDELFTLDLYHPVVPFTFKTTHDCHVYFRNSTSNSSGAGNGSYYLLTFTSNAATQASIYAYTRLRFTDN